MSTPNNTSDDLEALPVEHQQVFPVTNGRPSQVKVSVVVPMRNEAKHLHSCLRSLTTQTFPAHGYEILVADGCSTDDSRGVVSSFDGGDVRVRLLDNHSCSTPGGMNLGIRTAEGDIIIIAGAHTIYPQNFVENCVFWLQKTRADVVGGPLRTEAETNHLGGRLAALILSSPFGVGNSRFRTSSKEGWVDTVPFGAYRKAIFNEVGLFNEKLVRNQDNDLSARIRRAGGKIYMTPELETTYIAVRGFRDLLQQAYRKSQWHIFSMRQNIWALGFRHMCPAVFLIFLAGCLGVSPWLSVGRFLLGVLLVLYFVLGFSIALSQKRNVPFFLRSLMPFACLPFHLAYGAGTLFGIRHLFSPKFGDATQRITRRS